MKFTLPHYEDLKARVASMDIRELTDVVCVPNLLPTDKEKVYKSEIFFIHPGTAEDIKNKKDQLTEYKGNIPLFVSDFECGCGSMIFDSVKFQSMYAFGKANDPDAVYKIGRGVGDEGRRQGYTWSFSPCVDILIDHESPVASLRCASEEVDKVIETTRAYMTGMQDGGVVATLKHFPGDGATLYDQHLTTPENPLGLEEWYKTYGKIYKTLINDGAMSIMPGHIALPCYDIPNEFGVYPPATLSPRIMTDLLRGELGFEGIIVSDAVNMGGFCGYMNYYEACAKFLTAGGDMLLFAHPNEKLYTSFECFVADGTLPIEVLREKAYRACCFSRYCQTVMLNKEDSGVDMKAMEKHIVNRTVEVIRDRYNVLPYNVKKDTRILHVAVVNTLDNYRPYEDIDRLLREKSDKVTTLIDPGCGRMRREVEGEGESGNDGYDLIVCSIGSPTNVGLNSARIHGVLARNMMFGWTKLGAPAIFINFNNPYLYKEYNAIMDTIINTYGFSESVPKRVMELIFGEK